MSIQSTRRLLLVASAALAILLAACVTRADQTPASSSAAGIVAVAQGRLQGRAATDGVTAYLGVPYAAPPVGALRWQEPQPAATWSGVRTATAYGPSCAQQPVPALDSEDCLYLNIWTPRATTHSGLPVMVWIHGGGFVLGSGSLPTFDGTALAKKGVIVVTLNYRLGVFGYFAHPELTAASPHHASGNYGYADQLKALRWVRDNIHAFGGDPRRVTIFGQSAGSISVISLMASPRAAGLFQSAIAQSGTPLMVPSVSRAVAEQQGATFAAAQANASIAQLRALSADDLMRRWSAAHGSSWPIVDGWILPDSPVRVFAEHREMAIPLMTGIAAREGLDTTSDAQIPERLRTAYGDAASRADPFYRASSTPDPVLGRAAIQLATDLSFRCPALVIETWHAQRGAPVFAYQFEDTLPGQEAIRASHSSELPFVFGTMRYHMAGVEPPAATQLFSNTLTTYWTNFAAHGDPNGAGAPHWPRFSVQGRGFIHLNSAHLVADQNLQGQACDLYREAALPRLLSDVTPASVQAPPGAAPGAGPPYSTARNTLGELMDNPATRGVLERYISGLINNPQSQGARGQTLRSLQPYIAMLTDEKLASIDTDLALVQ